jgi:outer membrane protein OmpA-like peptidoglycan-associated protein
MQSQPKIYLEIVAHTDSIGTAENNQILSEKRANSVAEYMINQGIKRTRLVTKGLGEQQSSMRGLNPKTLADDRRVEFKIIRKS